MHATSGIALNSVVAEEANHEGTATASCSFRRNRNRHGSVDGVVGAIPSGYARPALCPWSN